MTRKIYLVALSLLAACKPASEKPAQRAPVSDTPPHVNARDTLSAMADTPSVYETYCNERYGYCLSYPADLVLMQPEAESGDGRIFDNTEGEELGRVYRSLIADPDAPPLSPKEAMNADMADLKAKVAEEGQGVADIVYATSARNSYVFSAKAGKWIYYRKAIFKEDEYAMLTFRYPEEQKARYDVVVSAMSQSFHW